MSFCESSIGEDEPKGHVAVHVDTTSGCRLCKHACSQTSALTELESIFDVVDAQTQDSVLKRAGEEYS